MQNFPEMSFDNLTLMQQASGLVSQNKALQFRVEELLAQKASSDAELERLLSENESLKAASKEPEEKDVALQSAFKPYTFFTEVLVPMVIIGLSSFPTPLALTHLPAQARANDGPRPDDLEDRIPQACRSNREFGRVRDTYLQHGHQHHDKVRQQDYWQGVEEGANLVYHFQGLSRETKSVVEDVPGGAKAAEPVSFIH